MLGSPHLLSMFRDLDKLSFHTQETRDSLWELVTTDASEKYQFRACPNLGYPNHKVKVLCEEVDVDGGTFMVTIV